MTQKKNKENHTRVPTWPLMRRLFDSYIKQHLGRISVAMVFMILSAAMTGAMAKLMEPIVDKVFSENNQDMLVPVAGAVFAAFTLRGIATYGHTVMMNNLGQRIISNMQHDMFAHLLRSDLAFFQTQQSGQFQSRFIADMTMIRAALTGTLTGAGKNSFTLLFLIILMFMQDWKLSVISLFVFPAAAYAVARLGKRLRKVAGNMQAQTGDLTSLLGQAIQGNKHVKAYGTEKFEQKRVGAIIENVYNLMKKSFKVAGISTPLADMLSGAAIVAIILYGGNQVMLGATTAGKLFSFIAAFLMAFEPMKRLARMNNSLQIGLAAIDRYFKLIDEEPEIKDKAGAADLNIQTPTVIFENVSFSYADGTEALKGISFKADAGKTIAFVGQSGAGKSTILNLIPRFYDVSSGTIKIDNQGIRDLTLKSLRQNMALVSQDVALFSDSVRDNIAYGTDGATQEDIEAAAKSAVAHDFIMELPNGYDTNVGENGVKLSGGQRQRIAIARAMLRNAPILLLDEATSALDAHSEKLVQTALDRLQKGKTTIVVAHRLSTIMNADTIFVMADGKIVETGNHNELVSKNGIYARLYSSIEKETA